MKKKHLFLTLMGAIALTGTVGFTSCADNNVAEETNPNYNAETNEVLANFVYSVSTGSQSTRMSAATVQIGDNTFRGIKDAHLFTYSLPSDGGHVYDPATQNALHVKDYDLDELISAQGLNASGKPDSRRVLELALPMNTNTLMLWGRAKKTGTDAAQGCIDFNPNANLNSARFTLKHCVPDDATSTGQAALRQYENLIATVLNNILNTQGTVNVTNGTKTVYKTMRWTDYVTFASATPYLNVPTYDPSTYDSDLDPVTNNAKLSPLGEILANSYIKLNTFQENELRNGEGRVTAGLIMDLYNLMHGVAKATPTTIEEMAAVKVADLVENEISKYFQGSADADLYWTSCQWKTITTVISNSGLAEEAVNKIDTQADVNDFPDGIFNLPPGATVMEFDNTNHIYKYKTAVPTYAMGDEADFDPMNYFYPAELCYFGNSPIRMTDDPHVVSDYPDGALTWDADGSWAAGQTGSGSKAWVKNSHVISGTRSVAMQENINYGTAMLKTTVKYGAANLKDNRKHFFPTEENAIVTPGGDGFKLTGILVGGQPDVVGWNFVTPATTTSIATYNHMIYDSAIPSTAIPAFSNTGTNSTQANYTMVWDNWNPSNKGAKQNVVYVSLQLKNETGQDFYGMNNIIRNGSTFYLIGTLDPDAGLSTTDRSAGITWPLASGANQEGTPTVMHYALPPYNTDGSTIQERRIFIQDYMTVANFTIGENSLKYALVSVPDLRSTQISLGLSVDLSWSNGLSFNDVIVGGTE